VPEHKTPLIQFQLSAERTHTNQRTRPSEFIWIYNDHC